ncbi:hypothetical protein G7046_g2946 [Stylonectria norvegica]|nr:hypothetical protein G7046_g2946 [Stylonectria norvegica]
MSDENAERELHRRRERAKIAQRAFRQRHSAAVHGLKEEHEKLKDLVRDIVNAAQVDDPAQLNAAIIQAGEAAGIETASLATKKCRPLKVHLDQVTSSSAPLVNPITPSDSPSPQSSDGQQKFVALRGTEGAYERSDTSVTSYRRTESGRFSPRFDYGLWMDPDRYRKIFQAPLDISPFLGDGMNTFAGKIMWACIDYATTLLEAGVMNLNSEGLSIRTTPADSGYSMSDSQVARSFFEYTLRHTAPLPVPDIAYLRAVIKPRIEFRTLGYMKGDNLEADEETSETLHEPIRKEFLKRGLKAEEWWSAVDIGRFIEATIGDDLRILESAILHGEDYAQTRLFNSLTLSLAKNSACSGYGPKWKATDAVGLVRAWACSAKASYAAKGVHAKSDWQYAHPVARDVEEKISSAELTSTLFCSVNNLRSRVAAPGTVVLPPPTSSNKVTEISNTPSDEEADGRDTALSAEPEFDSVQCLFCGAKNNTFDDNLAHMHKTHSFAIPHQEHLTVDLETLVGYLHLIIHGYGECILCAKRRSTVEGIQHHMAAKGHCRFNVASDIAEFYGSIPSLEYHVDEEALRLPSGKLLSHRKRAAGPTASRTRLQPTGHRFEHTTVPSATSAQESELVSAQESHTIATSSSQLPRLTRGDQQSLAHLPDHEVRSLLATSTKHIDRSRRDGTQAKLRLENAGNTILRAHLRADTTKRFRGPWG